MSDQQTLGEMLEPYMPRTQSLGERLELIVRAELEEELSEKMVHAGVQKVIGGLYTEWANHHYRREGGITEAENTELKAHTASLTDLQKLDAAIEVVTGFFGDLDAFNDLGVDAKA